MPYKPYVPEGIGGVLDYLARMGGGEAAYYCRTHFVSAEFKPASTASVRLNHLVVHGAYVIRRAAGD